MYGVFRMLSGAGAMGYRIGPPETGYTFRHEDAANQFAQKAANDKPGFMFAVLKVQQRFMSEGEPLEAADPAPATT